MAKAKVCKLCKKEYKGPACPSCTEAGVDVGKVLESEKGTMDKNESASPPTAFLVDLVSNRKIPITTPRCRVGRDDLNDIVISGDQSISRFHFIITFENGQYQVQDAKSRHGTFLNGNQITGPEPINDGDVLKIGVSLFWFVIESQVGANEDALPPVDVDKISSEEVSLKVGGKADVYGSEKELSATQEISMISQEQLAEYDKLLRSEKDSENKEPSGDKESKFDKDDDKKDDDGKSGGDKSEAPEKTEKEDDSKESKSDSKSDAKESKSDSKDANAKSDSKSDAKADSKDDEKSKKSDAKSEKKEEPEASESKDKVLKENDIEVAVKDLLEPLHDEIAASREMIRDALKKGELKDEDSEKSDKDENKDDAPESKSNDEESDKEPEADEEPQAEDSEKSDDDDNKDAKSDEPEEKQDSEPVNAKEEEDKDQNAKDEEPSAKKDKGQDEKSPEAETLEKIAEIIDDSSGKSEPAEKSDVALSERIEAAIQSDKATNGLDEDMSVSQMGPTTVPDWCKRYFSDELKHLNKELDALTEQIKQTQEKMKKIEGQAALTKGLRNTLLTADGDDLIEACKKILGMVGWKVTQSEEDKHELMLEHDDEKVLIARVIWTKGSAERSHLGQLSISQTRYWCEKGVEPKGVLIVGKISDKAPTERGDETPEQEVTEFANTKNVCIMSTLQLLALFRDIALKDGKTPELRSSIHDSKGWLKGFNLEPGDEAEEEEQTAKKSLSSLLSA